jgi:hypothetical protein
VILREAHALAHRTALIETRSEDSFRLERTAQFARRLDATLLQANLETLQRQSRAVKNGAPIFHAGPERLMRVVVADILARWRRWWLVATLIHQAGLQHIPR